MTASFFWAGALLLAAPLFSQTPAASALAEPRLEKGKLVWFRLTETRAVVMEALGQPLLAAEFGEDLISWQYRIGDREDEELSHFLIFRKSSGQLISVTRNYESEQDVDALFPAAETAAYEYRGEAQARLFVRVRKLGEENLLLAVGTRKPGDRTRQLVLTKRADLPFFYPWLAEAMKRTK